MYESFYRFSVDPFRLSPDPRFCFEHPSFSRARKYMQYALRRAEGFIMVTGRPGTGKTTLVETLLSGLSGGGPVAARLISAHLQPDELLRKVAYGFGLHAERLDKATILHQLERFLLQQSRTNRGALLVIDEAQSLDASALEELRLLTNLQENGRPVLQIFLVGQEQLREVVQAPELEQFHQRLIAACHLRPLDVAETRAYVEHRLRRVGWAGDPQLSGDAIVMVQRFSGGVPRRINQVCSRLLLHGASEGLHRLEGGDVLTVIEDLREEILTPADLPEFEELRGLLADQPPAGDADPVVADLSAPPPRDPGSAMGRPPPPPLPQNLGALDPPSGPAVDPSDPPTDPDLPPEVTAHLLPAAGPVLVATEAAAAAAGARRAPGAPEALRAPAGHPLMPPPPPRRRFLRRAFPVLALVALAAGAFYEFARDPAGPLRGEIAARIGRLTQSDPPARPATGPPLETIRGPGPTVRPASAQTSLATGVPPGLAPSAAAETPAGPGPSSAEPPAAIEPQAPPVATRAATQPPPPPVAVPVAPTHEPPPAPRPPPLPRVSQVPEDTTRPSVDLGGDAAITAATFPLPDVGDPGNQDRAASGQAPTPSVAGVALRPQTDRLERELVGLGLSAQRLDDGTLLLNLRRQVPFGRNTYEVRPESRTFLDQLAAVLRREQGLVVEVIGHTDESGTREYNSLLARRRAETVTAYLRLQGVPADALRAQGPRGSEPEPPEQRASPAELRRIDLYITRTPSADSRTAARP